MTALKIRSLIFIFSLIGFIGRTQTVQFEQFTTKHGLLSDDVYNLHQDRQGYIWIFTNYGALKYNGTDFKPVLKNLSTDQSFIYCIYENRKGEKWIANSKAQIFKVVRDSAFLIKGREKISEDESMHVNEIYQLYEDDSSNVYSITKRYCYKYKVEENGVRQFIKLNDELLNDSVVCQVFDKGDVLLPVRDFSHDLKPELEAYIKIEQDKKSFLVKVDKTIRGKPKAFKRYGKNIYFSHHQYIGKINDKGVLKYIDVKTEVLDFSMDKRHHLWVACFNNGLLELDAQDSLVNHYFEHSTVHNILIDSQEGLWASTAGSGLYHCGNLNTQYRTEFGGVSFLKCIEGKFYFGSTNGNIYSLQNNRVKCVIQGDKNNVAQDFIKFGHEYVVCHRLSIERLKIRDENQQGACFILKPGDNSFYTGALKAITLADKLGLYITRNYIGFFENDGIRNIFTTNKKLSGFEIRDKELFLATDEGVYQLQEKTPENLLNSNREMYSEINLVQPTYLAKTNSSSISKIENDYFGNLWFCSTRNGLFKLSENNNLQHLKESDGLPSNVIHDIAFNTNGDILLSTNKGLYFAANSSNDRIPRVWKNMCREEVRAAIFYEDKVYASARSGLLVLNLQHSEENRKKYFNLSSVFVNTNECDSSSLKKLKYYQNNLEFNFDLIDFSKNPPSVHYQLDGASSESGEAKNGHLKFQNLRRGRYVLTIFPVGAKELMIRLRFEIVPAFWQTKFFITCSILFVLLITIYILRRVFIRYKQKAIKQLEIEKMISEYKLTALKARFNPHFISNSLSAIQNLIYNGDIDRAGEYVGQFSFFMRQVLDYSDKNYINLEQEIAIIKLNVKLEQLRFKNDFSYSMKIEEGIALDEILIPSLITQPFIENAIWHGLLPLTTRAPKLRIDIFSKNKLVYLVIEDNGVGRKIPKEGLSESSNGMKLATGKIENLNKILERNDYKIDVEDLFDENGLPCGTKIIIQLPFNSLDE